MEVVHFVVGNCSLGAVCVGIGIGVSVTSQRVVYKASVVVNKLVPPPEQRGCPRVQVVIVFVLVVYTVEVVNLVTGV